MTTTVVATCLNAALDITYAVSHLTVGTTHRISQVDERAGGKGINVARVLAQLGEQVVATGFLGGGVGRAIRDDLAAVPLRDSFIEMTAASRRTVTVVDDESGASVFAEPGGTVQASEWAAFLESYSLAIDGAAVAVVSGSIPPGLDPGVYAHLVDVGHAHGVPTVVDVEGRALLLAAASGAAVLKPNVHELTAAVECSTARDGAHTLLGLGAGAVAVSLGADGLLLCTNSGNWRVWLEAPVTGNPTGAGDALVAALARGIAHGTGWHDIAVDAVALSAAAVRHPLAGSFHEHDYAQLRQHVIVEEVR